MRRIAMSLSFLLLTGCAGSYKAAYVTGAVTKQFTTESYGIYSDELNKKIDECDPESNPKITTKGEFDSCLGPFFKKDDHEKIESLVESYHAAAKFHSNVLLVVDAEDDARADATRKLFESAIDFLESLPEGDELALKLRKLTGKK